MPSGMDLVSLWHLPTCGYPRVASRAAWLHLWLTFHRPHVLWSRAMQKVSPSQQDASETVHRQHTCELWSGARVPRSSLGGWNNHDRCNRTSFRGVVSANPPRVRVMIAALLLIRYVYMYDQGGSRQAIAYTWGTRLWRTRPSLRCKLSKHSTACLHQNIPIYQSRHALGLKGSESIRDSELWQSSREDNVRFLEVSTLPGMRRKLYGPYWKER